MEFALKFNKMPYNKEHLAVGPTTVKKNQSCHLPHPSTKYMLPDHLFFPF